MLIVVFVSIGVIKLFLDVNWFNLKPEVTSIILGYNNFWQVMTNMDYFRSGLESPFIHLWYMAILMQFDLVFPFIFLLLKKIGDKINRIIPVTITLVISLFTGGNKSYEEIEKMYRLMCFNVFAHNRDDHSKNFSYIYNTEEKMWKLSPAYDLTYSNSIGGEHATMVDGNGYNPGMKEILQVAGNIGMDNKRAETIADDIYEIVRCNLQEYIK